MEICSVDFELNVGNFCIVNILFVVLDFGEGFGLIMVDGIGNGYDGLLSGS